MKKVKFNKQMQNAYKRYLTSRYYNNLYNCYNNPSYNKVRALEYCNELCNELNGYNLKIIGYNCTQFSVGFTFEQDDKLCFGYITKDYDRFCEIC